VIGDRPTEQFGERAPLGSLSSEVSDHIPDARQALADGFAQWSGAIRGGLQHMIDRGVLRADADPERLSLAMLAALQGGLLLAQAQRSTAALEAGLDTIVGSIRCYATEDVDVAHVVLNHEDDRSSSPVPYTRPRSGRTASGA
jgi:hypothetical protein